MKLEDRIDSKTCFDGQSNVEANNSDECWGMSKKCDDEKSLLCSCNRGFLGCKTTMSGMMSGIVSSLICQELNSGLQLPNGAFREGEARLVVCLGQAEWSCLQFCTFLVSIGMIIIYVQIQEHSVSFHPFSMIAYRSII